MNERSYLACKFRKVSDIILLGIMISDRQEWLMGQIRVDIHSQLCIYSNGTLLHERGNNDPKQQKSAEGYSLKPLDLTAMASPMLK